MKLRDFLRFKRISQKDFAKHLGISPVSLARYIGEKRFPEKKILNKIYKFSDGFVSANDFCIKKKNVEELSKESFFYLNKLLDGIRKGSRKDLAKTITLVESSLKKDNLATDYLFSKFRYTEKSIRIGVTGVPGVGKSTFIEALGLKLIAKGFKVAVLAIDPSSKRTGGSILGDKTRMEKLSINPNAFIRPSPSDGQLGGVAKKSRDSILCLEEFGLYIIFVETMGVGQAETEVYDMVDIFLVMLLPSGGDELQGIKKGIIELADILVVNKSDNELENTAELTRQDYSNALQIIGSSREFESKPDVLKCSSLKGIGIDKVWKSVNEFVKRRKKNGSFFKSRDLQKIKWMWGSINQKIIDYVSRDLKSTLFVKQIEEKVFSKKISIGVATNIILDYIVKK